MSNTDTDSAWGSVTMAPPDAILGITDRYNADSSPNKVNAGVGAYRDDHGHPFVLQSVRKAEKKVVEAQGNKEYLPIVSRLMLLSDVILTALKTGLAGFNKLAANLAYGPDCTALQENRIMTTTTLSGTGALRIAMEFLYKFYPSKTIYVPSPTYGNHSPIPQIKAAGMTQESYRYYDKTTLGLDFEGLKQDLESTPEKSIILMHCSSHNPTGVDPTEDEWRQIKDVLIRRKSIVLMDMAYQGFGSGDVDQDAFALRLLANSGIQILLAQSFAKTYPQSMGLYGERVGTLSVIAKSTEERERLESQIKIIIRSSYSSPPMHGSWIAATVLGDPELRKEWLHELKGMADRIIAMRKLLVSSLSDLGSQRDWSHITKQGGMFCFSGLTSDEVSTLAESHSVYLTKDGRMSIAGLTPQNIKHLAASIHSVTTQQQQK